MMLNSCAPAFVPGGVAVAAGTALSPGYASPCATSYASKVGSAPLDGAVGVTSNMLASELNGVIATEEALRAMLARLWCLSVIGVDCEGADLSRGSWLNGQPLAEAPGRPLHGQVCLMQISTEAGDVYAIDILELGAAAFDLGLRQLLESHEIAKVVHDFRQDADALWHQFKVRPACLIDCQLVDVLLRRFGGHKTAYVQGSARLFQTHNIGMESIAGCGQLTQELKLQIHARFSVDRHLWIRRPLPDDMVEYAKADVVPLLGLYNKLLQDLGMWTGSVDEAWHLAASGSAAYIADFRDGKSCRCRLCCNAAENARLDGYMLFSRMVAEGCSQRFLNALWRDEDSYPLSSPGPSKFYVNDKDESVPLDGVT